MSHPDYMKNAAGHLVPLTTIRPEHKLEDQLVREIFTRAEVLHLKIANFKKKTFEEITAFQDLLLEKYQAKKGGKKGNITLQSFDGKIKVTIQIADFIQFGPELQVAKDLIDECIRTWAKGTSDNIKALIDHAFRVDKQNRINTAAVLQLRQLDIKDETWERAMKAITDSIRITSSKQYVRFYTRPTPESDWVSVSLDIATA